MNLILCDDNPDELSLLDDYIQQWDEKEGLGIQSETCRDWTELAAALKQKEWDAVIVALSGVNGLDAAIGADPLSRRLIWISDLDFGVQAYRMCVTYFFMKPLSYQKMQRALDRALKDDTLR